MQYHRDDSTDDGNQGCSGNPHANSGEVPRRRWRLEKRKLATLTGCCREIYSLSALGTLSLHTSLPPKGRRRAWSIQMIALNLSLAIGAQYRSLLIRALVLQATLVMVHRASKSKRS